MAGIEDGECGNRNRKQQRKRGRRRRREAMKLELRVKQGDEGMRRKEQGFSYPVKPWREWWSFSLCISYSSLSYKQLKDCVVVSRMALIHAIPDERLKGIVDIDLIWRWKIYSHRLVHYRLSFNSWHHFSTSSIRICNPWFGYWAPLVGAKAPEPRT